MLKQFDKKDRHQIQKWIQKRSDTQHPDVTKAVLNILESVKTDGDQALINYTKQFDHVFLTSLEVTSDEINAAYAQVDKAFIDDMEQAKENIIFFHEAQKKQGFELQKENGVYSLCRHGGDFPQLPCKDHPEAAGGSVRSPENRADRPGGHLRAERHSGPPVGGAVLQPGQPE